MDAIIPEEDSTQNIVDVWRFILEYTNVLS